MSVNFRILSRNSELALVQSRLVANWLTAKNSALQVDIAGFTTKGDRDLSSSLRSVGGKGVFVEELEQKLIKGEGTIAVHSAKDLPVGESIGLASLIVGERASAADCVVFRDSRPLSKDSTFGTASLRRTALLRNVMNRTNTVSVRGNVQTRLAKLDAGNVDALVLAHAGLERLGITGYRINLLPTERFVPAAMQGALVAQFREDDLETRKLLETIVDPTTQACVDAERQVTSALGGNCTMAGGIYCEPAGDSYRLHTAICDPEGTRIVRVTETGSDPNALAEVVSSRLLRLGVKDLIDAN